MISGQKIEISENKLMIESLFVKIWVVVCIGDISMYLTMQGACLREAESSSDI